MNPTDPLDGEFEMSVGDRISVPLLGNIDNFFSGIRGVIL